MITKATLQERSARLVADIEGLIVDYLTHLEINETDQQDTRDRIDDSADCLARMLVLITNENIGHQPIAFLTLATTFRNALIATVENNLVNKVD